MTTLTTRSPLDALRDEVREFLADEIATARITPVGNSWLVGWDEEFSRRLAARGWVGMTVPQQYGGGGAGFLERFVVTEELLAAGAPVAAHWIADRQIAPSLLKFGTSEQKDAFLPGIARGEVYFAIGMSEPESGSDLASVRTKATQVDGGWRISGAKVWTSGAQHAHHSIVLARTAPVDAAARHSGLSQFILALDAPGVEVRPIISLDGSHHFNEVFLDDVFVPDDRVFGTIGEGWHQVTSELGYERSGPERFLSTFPLLVELFAHAEGDSAQRGALAARAVALHGASIQIARGLAAGAAVDTQAAIVKVLGTQFEGDVAEYAALYGSGPSPLRDAALLDRPGFTLRGGTNEILRGVIARGLGLR